MNKTPTHSIYQQTLYRQYVYHSLDRSTTLVEAIGTGIKAVPPEFSIGGRGVSKVENGEVQRRDQSISQVLDWLSRERQLPADNVEGFELKVYLREFKKLKLVQGVQHRERQDRNSCKGLQVVSPESLREAALKGGGETTRPSEERFYWNG